MQTIIRNFIVGSRIIWAETTKEQNGISLKGKPISKINNINWIKTKNEKDEFISQIESNVIKFSFGFRDKNIANPEIWINEIKCFEAVTKINKLTLVSMDVMELTLKNLEVLHLITPKFYFEEDLSVTHIVFFVYHDLCYEINGKKQIAHDYDMVFYPLNDKDVLFEIEIVEEDSFIIALKKVSQNGYLYFKVEAYLESLADKEYELPMVSDGNHFELTYVYIYLKQFLHERVTGIFVKSEQEKDCKKIFSSNKEKETSFGYFGNYKNNIAVLLVSFFLLFLSLFVFWFKKIHFKKKKLRFKKNN